MIASMASVGSLASTEKPRSHLVSNAFRRLALEKLFSSRVSSN